MCQGAHRPFLPGKAALDADLKKCDKHSVACELSGYGFKAFATDICGVISPSSHCYVGLRPLMPLLVIVHIVMP
jgi:hypothetical protein